MKKLKLDLKKKVLIIDGNNCAYISDTSLVILGGVIYNIPEDYEFLCKGSDLTEEIASELVNETLMYEKHKVKCSRYRSYREGFVAFDNAIESFISAVESKGFYWLENPIKKSYYNLHKGIYEYEPTMQNLQRVKDIEKWQEAEEKTFKNPLIFVKK